MDLGLNWFTYLYLGSKVRIGQDQFAVVLDIGH